MDIGGNNLIVYLSYSDGFLWRIFPLLRANRLYIIFCSGLKVWLLLVQDTFRLPLPGVLALDSFATTSFRKLIFLFPISADGRRGLFPLCDSSQSFGFYLLSSPIRRFVWATICPCIPFFTHLITKYKHFPFWPGFVTSGLTYIISLNGHSLTAC